VSLRSVAFDERSGSEILQARSRTGEGLTTTTTPSSRVHDKTVANLQKTQYVLLDGQAYGLATVLSCTLLLGVVVVVKPSPVRDRACKISEPLRSSNATERKDTSTIIITNTVSG
jgi:hypothetical protein